MELLDEEYLMDHPDSDEEIPILDVAPYFSGEPGALQEIGAQLRHISENVGFFYMKGHGVPQTLIDRMFVEAKRFHALPLEDKLAIRLNEDNHGYLAMNDTLTKVSSLIKGEKTNINAGFLFGRDRTPDDPAVVARRRFRGLNQWPQNLPGFRETMLEYYGTIEALTKRFLPVWATALELREDYFAEAFREPQLAMRITHYPPQEEVGNRRYGLAPHCDNGFMTILAQSNVPGLAVRMPSGHWRLADIIPGTLIVNTGNLMMRWTNDRFLSTKHRVINLSGADRYVFPMFTGPNLDTMIECVPSCRGPGRPARYEPVTWETLTAWFFDRKNAPAAEPGRVRETATA